MTKHPETKVIIKGYASPEGSAELNARLAAARAEAVKTILVKRYRIAADRVTAEGQGVGDMFTEPDWNRVSICTIEESNKENSKALVDTINDLKESLEKQSMSCPQQSRIIERKWNL